jgi:Uma2 family endonuclease
MAKHIEDEVVYHYDLYPTREDLMGETSVHARLVRYLVGVLTWLFQGQPCAIHENLNFYQTRDAEEYPLAPDIAVIKGVEDIDVPSWKVGRTGPAPQVVFEIASKETWTTDQAHKPLRYARMGVQEYFAYDPNEPLLDREATSRLTGWQFDAARQYMQKMPLRPDGSLWSVHLDSFLVPAGKYLYLSDRQGRLRLTQAQAEAQRAEAEKRRADAEAKAREAEAQRAEQEARRADAEAKRAEALAEKLRSLGIDPNQL